MQGCAASLFGSVMSTVCLVVPVARLLVHLLLWCRDFEGVKHWLLTFIALLLRILANDVLYSLKWAKSSSKAYSPIQSSPRPQLIPNNYRTACTSSSLRHKQRLAGASRRRLISLARSNQLRNVSALSQHGLDLQRLLLEVVP